MKHNPYDRPINAPLPYCHFKNQKTITKPRKKFRTRRLFIRLALFSIVLAIFAFSPASGGIFANNTSPGNNILDDLTNNVNDQLGNIDFGDLDDIANNLTNNDFNLFGTGSFTDMVGRILRGQFAEDYPNVFAALLSMMAGIITGVLPMVVLIVAISILCGFVQTMRHTSGGDGVRDIIHFVAYAAVISIVLYAVVDVVATTGRTLGSMQRQMDVIFPILLTLMTSIGSTASAGVYQPAVVMLSSGVMQIFQLVVMPLFIITLVFSVVGNLSQSTRFDKFVSFFTSCFKWILGVAFTVFLAFLTIQGISAGTHDGISIRAARLTISSYIPYLGGYLSQGFDLIMASSILIKNAIGVAGLYLLFGVVMGPVVSIVVLGLGLKLAAAITQPIGDPRISNFLTSINKSFSMLLACIIGAAFMYFLTIGLVIMTGNVL